MADLEILLKYLLDDGLLEGTTKTRIGDSGTLHKLYRLKKKGADYVARWPPT